MKLFTFISVFSMATITYACPDLTGTYSCEGETVEISMSTNGGDIFYNINGEEVPAEGDVSIEEEDFEGTYNSTCSGDKLVLGVEGIFLEGGSEVGTITEETSISLDGTNLNYEVTGTVVFGGEEIPVEETITCTAI